MTLKIIETKENPFLKRKEVSASLEAMKSPSKEEVKEKLAQQLKSDKELTVIKDIRGSYGNNNFSVKAFIYHDKVSMEQTEPKPKAKPGSQAQGQPAQAPAAPAKK